MGPRIVTGIVTGIVIGIVTGIGTVVLGVDAAAGALGVEGPPRGVGPGVGASVERTPRGVGPGVGVSVGSGKVGVACVGVACVGLVVGEVAVWPRVGMSAVAVGTGDGTSMCSEMVGVEVGKKVYSSCLVGSGVVGDRDGATMDSTRDAHDVVRAATACVTSTPFARTPATVA